MEASVRSGVVYGGYSNVFGGFSLFVWLLSSQDQGVRVIHGVSSSLCPLSRICLVSPTWRNGSALRILGQVLLPGLGRWFRVLIESVEALPARRPSGILAIPVLCWPVGSLSRLMFRFFCRTQSFVPWWCFAAACLSRVARCCVVLTLAFVSIMPIDSSGAVLVVWYAPSP
ncbi:hypothetical protein DY000_02045907 [Brassica cretica]|uniref:Uncharacterized protein n=1 Tax=Brassica cretica TaxID=69181 RepID=A0ABQ7F419_BRACR|nr:hypothetical protein DY000_02045907 [Brassica cretica]